MSSNSIQLYSGPTLFVTTQSGDSYSLPDPRVADVATKDLSPASQSVYAALSAAAMYSPEAILALVPPKSAENWSHTFDGQLQVSASKAEVAREISQQRQPSNSKPAAADWDAVGAVLLKRALSSSPSRPDVPMIHRALHLVTGRVVESHRVDHTHDDSTLASSQAVLYAKLHTAAEAGRPVVMELHSTSLGDGLSTGSYAVALLPSNHHSSGGNSYISSGSNEPQVVLRSAEGNESVITLYQLVKSCAFTYSVAK